MGNIQGGGEWKGSPWEMVIPFLDLGFTSDLESPTSVFVKLTTDGGKFTILTMKAGIKVISY